MVFFALDLMVDPAIQILGSVDWSKSRLLEVRHGPYPIGYGLINIPAIAIIHVMSVTY